MSNKKVWYVTGASKGLGLILVKKLLATGAAVAATSRHLNQLINAIGTASDQFLPLAVDITNEESVRASLEQTVAHFGRVDVIVNNAGYGLLGGLEELSDKEVRGNFEVNVFGLLHVIRHATRYLRAQGAGHVFNISSIGGFFGAFPGWGIYCATKFAVDGLTEAFFQEMKAFGVHVTTVKPGYFRTEFLSAGSLVTPANPIDTYVSVRESQVMHQQQLDGNQLGDPEKAVEVIIAAAEAPQPPLHLFLGQDAYDMAARKIADVQDDLKAWEAQAVATAFA
ncbi:SDR family NAD(P)-dependent oxidoreductase [Chitinophaga pendula]|uniref:SDR family NAD(P)-dependent oxidoreductase n=1 Tax=Chitinophaga TaxID=79328 RepID=UPI000BB09026|nr:MULTISPECIES: SDR family NAD(P)-dependent oxidoreductase [Chitinophaga]ASZ13814.1 short-chain dehydrogenase/reductase [Chitinophaga sp. MD30]UCJ08565.1 SDR family NAD(P)-dependent oxidoreductase [Chitinophaga pendula]